MKRQPKPTSYTVTRYTDPEVLPPKSIEANTIKDAGRIVAYGFLDNTRADKREATHLAMRAEREGGASAYGYTYRITPNYAEVTA